MQPNRGDVRLRLRQQAVDGDLLAEAMGVARKHVNEWYNDRRVVTAPTALILASVFGNWAEFWLNVQRRSDLWEAIYSPGDGDRVVAMGGGGGNFVTHGLIRDPGGRAAFADEVPVQVSLILISLSPSFDETDVAPSFPPAAGQKRLIGDGEFGG